VVEDNRDVQRYLGGFLEKEYTLLFASNGVEGIDQAVKHVPDLIVSDVMMPQMNGDEMCSKLKADPATSHIPLILLTARAGRESLLSGLKTGADDYLTKPFDAQELLARIHNLIEQRRKLQEKFSTQNPFNPQKLDFSENDRSFLGRIIEMVNKNVSNPSFSTEMLAAEMALSRTQLFRKLKSLTGKSVSDFIRHTRLNHAAELLKSNQGNVSEVAFAVGFNHLGNFSRYFKNQFGVLPSDYAKNHSPHSKISK
jgi:DNA-binding response OmpR family regulator